MNKFLPIAVLNDLLTALKIPTNTLNFCFVKKAEKLREIIACEIRQGDFSKINKDELISVFYKLITSTIEGTAKNNLKLMCQVANGMIEKNDVKADNFLRYANILATLTEDEIIFLGIAVKENMFNSFFVTEDFAKCFSSKKLSEISQSLTGQGLIFIEPVVITKRTSSKKENLIDDERHHCIPEDGWETSSEKYFIYKFTPIMEEIAKYINSNKKRGRW